MRRHTRAQHGTLPQREPLSSSRLNFKASLYRECDITELLCVAGVSLVGTLIVLTLVTSIVLKSAMIGVALSFPTSFGVGMHMTRKLQASKQDKPPGTYLLQLRLTCEDRFGIKTPVVRGIGPWSVGCWARGKHV